jgi:hypothetical protein
LGWVNSNHDISAKVGTGKELLESFIEAEVLDLKSVK